MQSTLTESTMIDFSTTADAFQAVVLDCQAIPTELSHENKLAIFTNRTTFHPVDYRWPDQPADKGTLTLANNEVLPVIACTIAAKPIDNAQLYFGAEIPVRRGTADWLFFVVHIVDVPEATITINNIIGQSVYLNVDQSYRLALSAGHSACHLAALAFNKATLPYWQENSKSRLDSLGNPDLDSHAISISKILPYASEDIYRFGKTLRKSGLQTATLFTEIQRIEEAINEQLKIWLAANPSIMIEPMPSKIADMRWWHCHLPEGKASIPCGGTHIQNFKRHNKTLTINVRLSQLNENEMLMRTTIDIP